MDNSGQPWEQTEYMTNYEVQFERCQIIHIPNLLEGPKISTLVIHLAWAISNF